MTEPPILTTSKASPDWVAAAPPGGTFAAQCDDYVTLGLTRLLMLFISSRRCGSRAGGCDAGHAPVALTRGPLSRHTPENRSCCRPRLAGSARAVRRRTVRRATATQGAS